MAWSSDDQNPSLSPSQTSGVNYAAQLNSAAYYNPLSGGSSSTGMAPVSAAAGQPTYAQRLSAAAPAQPKQTTGQALVDSLMASRQKHGNAAKVPQQSREPQTFVDPFSSGKLNPQIAERYQSGRRVPVTIRNNNPGAVSIVGQRGWAQTLPGYIDMTPRPRREGGHYARFATPEYGVAAASRNLERYGAQGRNTISKIVSAWAAEPGDYAKTVSRFTGYGLNDELDLSDPDVRANLLMGMSAHESGAGVPVYRPEVYRAGSRYDFEGGSTIAAAEGTDVLAGGNVPMPRMRPNTQSAAYGADGARSMAYADEGPSETPFDAVFASPPDPRPRPQRDTLASQAGPYVVRRGDTLSAIAQRELGDPNRWREIAQANGIRDPRSLMPGQQLVIPAAATRTVDIPQPRVRPRIASGPVGPTTRQGVLDMGPTRRPADRWVAGAGGAPDAGRVPEPRMRPAPAMAQWDDIDAMTEVDEQGNYLAQPAPQAPPRAVRESSMPLRTDAQGNIIVGPADVGREASEYRSRALAGGAQDGPGLDGLVEGFGQELRQSGRFRYPSGWSAADIGREVSDKRQMFIEAGVPPGPQLDKIVNDYERMLMQMIAPQARGQPAVAGLQGPPAYTAGNGVRIWIG